MSNIEISITVNPGSDTPYTCSPDPVPVHGKDRVLQWEIQTDGWVFSTSRELPAIVFGGTNPASEFDTPNVTGNGKRATVKDKNTAVADFPYTVNLVHTATGARFSFDPAVGNKNAVVTEPLSRAPDDD